MRQKCQNRVIKHNGLSKVRPNVNLRAVGFSWASLEKNHCEQPFDFPSSMRELRHVPCDAFVHLHLCVKNINHWLFAAQMFPWLSFSSQSLQWLERCNSVVEQCFTKYFSCSLIQGIIIYKFEILSIRNLYETWVLYRTLMQTLKFVIPVLDPIQKVC